MPPGDFRRALQELRHTNGGASLLSVNSSQDLAGSGEFQPSEEFQRAGEGQGEVSELPWGVGTPRTGDSWPVHEYSAMHMLDVPHWVEYSLETGDNIQTFSSAWQDVKLITQVLENVTNGFYLDTHGGDGETNSYTLLLELTGWRGLILEPQIYEFATLWGKLRKAWIFLGCLSPTGNATKIGFDTEGVIDMESGHFIHAYNIPTFMEELGGRKTIDFWAVHNGHYEAEVLNETFFYSGKNIEFGVVLVRFDGRRTGRGYQFFAQHRSKDATEELIFEIMHNASFNYIGGLDAYWINYVEPRFHYMDHVWVNPAYFERRGLPVPTWCKSAPPPKLEYPRQGHLNVPGLDQLEKWEGSGSSPGPHVYGHATSLKAGVIPFKYGLPGTPYGHGEWYGGGGGGQWDPRWDWDAGYTYHEEVDKVRGVHGEGEAGRRGDGVGGQGAPRGAHAAVVRAALSSPPRGGLPALLEGLLSGGPRRGVPGLAGRAARMSLCVPCSSCASSRQIPRSRCARHHRRQKWRPLLFLLTL
ncbi:unnamed protein product [Prorocentrum cordatum]|uniref:Phospholipase B-like n=1 Tax=Prorocentrum cordatum TaxID=2364126 RepID=A0ABN9QJI2_9DINO|nr:unnamed protein product [Polarella glacialis]